MSFNLLPWREMAHAQQKKRLYIELILALFCALIISQGVRILYLQAIDHKKIIIVKLQQQIEALQPDYLAYISLVDKNKNNELHIQIISGAIARYEMITNFLAKMRTGMPEEIHLTQLYINDKLLQLEGESISHAGIASLLKYLETLTNKSQPSNSETRYDENNAYTHFLITYSLPFTAH